MYVPPTIELELHIFLNKEGQSMKYNMLCPLNLATIQLNLLSSLGTLIFHKIFPAFTGKD